MTLSRSLSSLISSSSPSFVHVREVPLLRPLSTVYSYRYYSIINVERNPKNGTTNTPPELLSSSPPDHSSSSKAPASNGKPTRPSVIPWIPIIFPGTLAESAATHLREKDTLYVTGHLTRAAAEPASHVKDVPESGLQLIASDFKIVLEKKIDLPHTPQKVASKSIASGTQYAKPKDILWKDLVTNPSQWIDCRLLKQSGSVNPRSPDFKRKDSDHALWVDTAPQWASKKLDGLPFAALECDNQNTSSASTARETANGAGNKVLQNSLLWNDLVRDPLQWVDYRMSKRNESVKPLHPDFKNKKSRQSLWLHNAPKSVLEKLKTLTFALPKGGIGRTKMTSKFWRNATAKSSEKGSKSLGDLFRRREERQQKTPDATRKVKVNTHKGAQKAQARAL